MYDNLLSIIRIKEPIFGRQLLESMNEFVHKHYIVSKVVPFTADIFVFVYPVYLTALYLFGVIKKEKSYKEEALYIFFSSISTVLVNIIIQAIVYKERPEEVSLLQEDLILSHLPDRPFPSDHAALSAAIATSTLILGVKNKKIGYIYFSIVLFLFSITMSVSRVASGVHWPTDVVFGTLLGILMPLILIKNPIYKFLSKYIFDPLIKLQKYIFRKFFFIKED